MSYNNDHTDQLSSNNSRKSSHNTQDEPGLVSAYLHRDNQPRVGSFASNLQNDDGDIDSYVNHCPPNKTRRYTSWHHWKWSNNQNGKRHSPSSNRRRIFRRIISEDVEDGYDDSASDCDVGDDVSSSSSSKSSERSSRGGAVCTLIIFCFLTATTAIPTILVIWTRRIQREQYEHHFNFMATSIISSVQEKLVRTMSAMNDISIQITAQKHVNQQSRMPSWEYDLDLSNDTTHEAYDVEWPYITVPDFDNLASAALDHSYDTSLFMGYYPKVTLSQQAAWEDYVGLNYNEMYRRIPERHILELDSAHIEDDQESDERVRTSWRWNQETGEKNRIPTVDDLKRQHESGEQIGLAHGESDAYYLPLWHSVPMVTDFVNGDLLVNSREREIFQIMEATQESYFGLISDVDLHGRVDDNHDHTKHTILHDLYIEYYTKLLLLKAQHSDEVYRTELVSPIYYPVFDDDDDDDHDHDDRDLATARTAQHGRAVSDISKSAKKRRVVGAITSAVYWPSLFEGTLSRHYHHTAYVMVQNPCHRSFLIQIQGGAASFLRWEGNSDNDHADIAQHDHGNHESDEGHDHDHDGKNSYDHEAGEDDEHNHEHDGKEHESHDSGEESGNSEHYDKHDEGRDHSHDHNGGEHADDVNDYGENAHDSKHTGKDDLGSSHAHGDKILYNDLKKTFKIEDIETWTLYQDLQVAPLRTGQCPYAFTILSSENLKQEAVTREPYLFGGGIFVAIILIALVFLVHDQILRAQIRRVLRSSSANRRVVDEYFPRQLRERLMHRPPANASTTEVTEHGVDAIIGNARRRTKESGGTAASRIVVGSSASFAGFQPHAKTKMKAYFDGATATEAPSHPVADLFPSCTVLFADICGFSAWSSTREPEHIFELLESVFSVMDKTARLWKVFKVETVGDTFMAVTGLPDPQPDHALRMARFARNCVARVHHHLRQLQTSLGPDTGDMRLRVGMNSGQVTAGFLGGQKIRFQLFGDTVNTAARVASTSSTGRIQVSAETAVQILKSGNRGWLTERNDRVYAKGKGMMATYWLSLHSSSYAGSHRSRSSAYTETSSILDLDPQGQNVDESSSRNVGDSSASTYSSGSNARFEKAGNSEISRGSAVISAADERSVPMPLVNKPDHSHLVDWTAKILAMMLENVVAHRVSAMSKKDRANWQETTSTGVQGSSYNASRTVWAATAAKRGSVIDEVVEAFDMPPQQSYSASPRNKKQPRDDGTIQVSANVKRQLRNFVAVIADRYHDNAFHNFEHCVHVIMASAKLLERIVGSNSLATAHRSGAAETQGQTYGIASNALAQFAVVFCALIHDVDHRGVSNQQLSKEMPEQSRQYNHESIAEQNSVTVAWNVLLEERFADFRRCIYSTENELRHFRQYVVNLVVASDIFNPRLKAIREQRWRRAFDTGELMGRTEACHQAQRDETEKLKATIVLEHIIQAADVSHTMQHWNVYTKWNERLFHEMLAAYEDGRAAKDPTDGWYQGELWFFDNYVIPLARKLEHCGIFGVSSDEYLNYALENRERWARQGSNVVKRMAENYRNGAIGSGVRQEKVGSSVVG